MRQYYIKQNELYLHVQTIEQVEYQDYSDINSMYTMQYVFKKEKESAKKFLDISEASIFVVKRKLKNVKIVCE